MESAFLETFNLLVHEKDFLWKMAKWILHIFRDFRVVPFYQYPRPPPDMPFVCNVKEQLDRPTGEKLASVFFVVDPFTYLAHQYELINEQQGIDDELERQTRWVKIVPKLFQHRFAVLISLTTGHRTIPTFQLTLSTFHESE